MRPEDQRHIDHRSGIGDNGKHGEPDLTVQRRPQQKREAGDPSIAQRSPKPHGFGMPGLRQSGEQNQKQKRDFLDDQSGHHRQRHRIIDDQQVRWPVETGEPGRDQPHDQARWRNQERQPERRGCMRHRQQRRNHPPRPGECRRPEVAGDKTRHRAKRHKRGHQPDQDRQDCRAVDPRNFSEGREMRRCEAVTAQFGQIAQRWQSGSGKTENQRAEQDRERQGRRQSRQAHTPGHIARLLCGSASHDRQFAAP